MPVRPLPFTLTTACCLLLGACASTGTPATPQAGAPIAVQVPVVAHPGGETPAWWYRSGAAQASARGAEGECALCRRGDVLQVTCRRSTGAVASACALGYRARFPPIGGSASR